MRLWFDEDLSPTLVHVANEHGLEATCNRDRGALGYKDPKLRRLVQAEGFAFVTDNASDFTRMYERDAIHPGLLVMPAEMSRDAQRRLLCNAIDWIAAAAADAGQAPADFMVNKLVEIERGGQCSARDLPDG